MAGLVAVSAAAGTLIALAAHGSGAGTASLPQDLTSLPALATAPGGQPDTAAIAARIDPAVADVTADLAGDAGVAAGTGMVLTPNGVVLTNNHVIAGSSRVTVQIGGQGPTYTARVVGVDPVADVAVLQIGGASGLPTISVGRSAGAQTGDPVVAIGNALGLQGPPAETQGRITALDRTITAGDDSGGSETLTGMIQTDAPIQPGDSGGPLVSATGQVIGMDTAAAGRGGFRNFGRNAGFAIPIDHAIAVARQIVSGHGANVQGGQGPLLGVDIEDDGIGAGAYVDGVQDGGPAQSAGLAEGDVIDRVGGQAVGSAAALSAALSTHRPGDRVDIGWRDSFGRRHSATVRLAAGPPV